jgi:hypothetical protein
VPVKEAVGSAGLGIVVTDSHEVAKQLDLHTESSQSG